MRAMTLWVGVAVLGLAGCGLWRDWDDLDQGGPGGAAACPGTTSGTWCVETLSGQTSIELQSVWSDRPDDVWIVGWHRLANGDREAAMMRWNGHSWSTVANPDPANFQFSTGVWGSSAHDVWVVGVGAGALHFDGRSMSFVPMPIAAPQTVVDIRQASGTASNDVWTGGHQVLHWDGTAWTAAAIDTGDPNQYFAGVWAVAPNDVWATGDQVVAHFDGASWTVTQVVTGPIGLASFLYTIWADSNQAWAAGPGGRIHHFQNGTWTLVSSPTDSGPLLYSLAGRGDDVYLAGTQSFLDVLQGDTFVPVPDAPASGSIYQGVWVSPSQVWVVGMNQSDEPIVLRRQR